MILNAKLSKIRLKPNICIKNLILIRTNILKLSIFQPSYDFTPKTFMESILAIFVSNVGLRMYIARLSFAFAWLKIEEI